MSVTVSRLDNGIRVVTDAMAHVETVSVGVWVDVGARYESERLNGVSHLLEHMAFKGTRRRSARDIAEQIEAVGGHLNAYTSRDHTTYYARTLKEDLPLALDILADILQHSLFDPGELARERDVIVQEIGQANDTPDDIIFDDLQATAFPDQPLGRSILGTEDRVAGFNADTVRGYMAAHYRGDSMVVAAAGHVDHGAVVKLVERAFGALERPREAGFEKAVYGGGAHHSDRPLEQLHIALGLPSLAFDDPDYYALQVFSTILGGGMSSRLFQEVRENRGLAYSVYSFASSHADAGLFGIYAGTGPEQAGQLMPVIAGELAKLADAPLDDEVARARAQLKAGLMMSLESTSSRIEQLGRQMLIFDRIVPVEEMVAKVEAIDTQAVRRVARHTRAGRLTLATVGPRGGLADYEALAALFAGR